MAAKKKATAKPTAKLAKKKPVVKAVPKKTPTISVKEPLSKGGIINAVVEMTGLVKKDVVSVLDSFSKVIELHVKSRGPGKFTMPGLLKITVVKKPAKPARKGVNPFTGEEVTFKAKPAHKAVKIKALKKLKEMAE
jgi:nucleoid DNA-binding protein